MIYYYKQLSSDGAVEMLLTYERTKPNITNPLVMEITQEEYEVLLAELQSQSGEEPEAYETPIDEALAILTGEMEADA